MKHLIIFFLLISIQGYAQHTQKIKLGHGIAFNEVTGKYECYLHTESGNKEIWIDSTNMDRIVPGPGVLKMGVKGEDVLIARRIENPYYEMRLIIWLTEYAETHSTIVPSEFIAWLQSKVKK